MGTIDDKFTINTLILCLIVYMMLLLSNALALNVKNSLEHNQEEQLLEDPKIPDAIKQEILDNRENESNIDLWSIMGGIGDIAFGTVYPFPLSIIIALFSTILLLVISICIALFVKEWIPFI
jgi:ABC-type phosphate transport system permease subunit